jgi:putative AdoMet-dependent methyltransferase
MRSRHADEFDHTGLEDVYDTDVGDETDPIRTGYAEALRWTVARAEITPDSVVVDLGAGTGNTSALIRVARHVVCVDVSAAMMERARSKLAHLASVEYVEADLLEFFDTPRRIDRLVSTYAVHHLTDDEKGVLLERIASSLPADGIAVFGDLMFEDRAGAAAMARKYAGVAEVIESFEEEFFWLVDASRAHARNAGLTVTETRRFSDLSWGLRVEPVADASAGQPGSG